MATCAICSKKLNLFNIRKDIYLKNGEQICLSCSNKLDSNILNEISNMDKEEVINLIKRNKRKDECCLCHEKLTIFNTGIANRLKSGERICVSCVRKLEADTLSKLGNLTLDNLIESVAIQEKKQDELKIKKIKERNKELVIEYKRTCNHCGKVWHVLAEREKYLESEKKWNSCNMCASALAALSGDSNYNGTFTQAKRNQHALNDEINKLKQCPNCMSTNYSEEQTEYEKK